MIECKSHFTVCPVTPKKNYSWVVESSSNNYDGSGGDEA